MQISMRLFIGNLLLFFSLLNGLNAGTPNQWTIDSGLKELKSDTPVNQVEHLNRNEITFSETVLKSQTDKLSSHEREQFFKSQLTTYDQELSFSPEFLSRQYEKLDPKIREDLIKKEIAKNEGDFTFSSDFLDHHYDKLDPLTQDMLLKTLLNKLDPSDQQGLVNDLNREVTYKDLLMHVSEEGCLSVTNTITPNYVGTTPLISYLNTTELSSFFDPKMKRALLNRGHYNDFNPYDQYSVWLEPFGYGAKFHRKDRPRHFDLYTLGLLIGGEFTFLERLTVDLALGYSYSKIKWNGYSQKEKGTDQALYFGPSLNYLFTKGHLSIMLVGVGNFYHMKRDISLFPEIPKKRSGEASYQSWDLLTRLEGSFSIKVGQNWYVYPQGRVDYLNTFQLNGSEKIEEDLYLNFEGLHESFLFSKVGVQLTHERFQPALGYLIPSLTSGFKWYSPQSFDAYRYKLKSCEGLNKISYGSWIQYFIGAGIALTHIKGAFLTFDYELSVGYHAPLQKFSFRGAWYW